jgi:hypothetical protein
MPSVEISTLTGADQRVIRALRPKLADAQLSAKGSLAYKYDKLILGPTRDPSASHQDWSVPPTLGRRLSSP